MAPSHGQEDYLACKANGLPIEFRLVDETGHFNSDAGYELSGIFVCVCITSIQPGLSIFEEGSRKVVDLLKEAGALYRIQRYNHRYPYDWRTKKPVIQRATQQWFADLSGVKSLALAAANSLKVELLTLELG